MSGDTRPFDQLPAYRRLRELAGAAPNLAAAGFLSEARITSCVCGAAGFDLLYATQQVDETILEALQELADQSGAVDSFLAMKQGAVLNRIEGHESENRQVLHTACRDLFSDNPHHSAASDQAGKQLARLERFLAELDEGSLANADGRSFTDYVNIGIGGSDLGPRAVYLALSAYGLPERRVHFISNVDPDDAAGVIKELDLSRTLVGVVSKSGTTLETLTNEELVRQAFRRAGLTPERHFVAVTGRGSPMDDRERYLRTFHMFDYIGGRYSTTSMVGAVLLGFGLGGPVVREFLRGANRMDTAAEKRDILKNPALLLALLGIWNHNFLGRETVAILPYSQALQRFPAHLQQCDMESNGKSVTRRGDKPSYQTGPIVWGEPGTNGQHAFYQLLHQGTAVVPVEFIGFRRSQYEQDQPVKGTISQEKLLANLLAQSLALATGRHNDNPNKSFAGNRPSSILIADRLTPAGMGALLALYEAKIVFQGFIWGINSFDQEGVQLGKVLADRFLAHFKSLRREQNLDRSGRPEERAMLAAAGLAAGGGE